MLRYHSEYGEGLGCVMGEEEELELELEGEELEEAWFCTREDWARCRFVGPDSPSLGTLVCRKFGMRPIREKVDE